MKWSRLTFCRFTFALAVAPIWAVPGKAEVFHCGELYSSAPCDGSVVDTPGLAKSPDADNVGRQKRAIIMELEHFSGMVARETGHAGLEAAAVSDFCKREKVSVEECQARALKTDKAMLSDLQIFRRRQAQKQLLSQRQQELAFHREKLISDLHRRGRRGQ